MERSAECLRKFLAVYNLKKSEADRAASDLVKAGYTNAVVIGRYQPKKDYLDKLVQFVGLGDDWDTAVLPEGTTRPALGISATELANTVQLQLVHSQSLPTGATVEMVYAGEVPASGFWGNPLQSNGRITVDAKHVGRDRYVCRVAGMSCWPALIQADLIVVEPDMAPPMGSLVLAQNKADHGCTVKVVQLNAKTGEYVLVAPNPDSNAPDPGDGWGAIGRVTGVERIVEGSPITIVESPRAGLRVKLLSQLPKPEMS